jgi:hypothetical protein
MDLLRVEDARKSVGQEDSFTIKIGQNYYATLAFKLFGESDGVLPAAL